jgi:hypothetical protein
MLSIKKGVKLTGIKPEIVIADIIMDQVYTQYGIQECEVTSGVDGVHMKGSKHYTGEAHDYKTKHMPDNIAVLITEVAQKRLGENYDVIFETNHIHCEFDPK